MKKNGEINRQYNSIIRLEDSQKKLIYENQNLINWIMQILDIFGTVEMSNRSSVQIPIYEEKFYREYDANYLGIQEKERITIPEITIIRMG